ncbi:hypothetical protein C8Q72DRAFT_936434 [Fomitopsis betulina]|nr:hypothetical protein C8Q72DRAFT_936434 [Fomitopsis betulina]
MAPPGGRCWLLTTTARANSYIHDLGHWAEELTGDSGQCNIDTELVRHAPKFIQWFLVLSPPRAQYATAYLLILGTQRKFIVQPAYLGALMQLWAGTMPEALNQNAGFLIPWAHVDKCRKEAYDNELGQKLWDTLEDTVKDK